MCAHVESTGWVHETLYRSRNLARNPEIASAEFRHACGQCTHAVQECGSDVVAVRINQPGTFRFAKPNRDGKIYKEKNDMHIAEFFKLKLANDVATEGGKLS